MIRASKIQIFIGLVQGNTANKDGGNCPLRILNSEVLKY
jgi:hypothetical protein